jgi:hypothetical protein
MNILVTGARAPIAADLAKALALSGHKVWVADSLNSPVGAGSPFIQRSLRLPPPRPDFSSFQAALLTTCAEFDIGAIIPTSEEVFWLAGAAPALPPSVNLRTSPLPVLARLHHKGTFAILSANLGYGVPATHKISHESDLAQLGDLHDWVLKPVYSRFGARTLISPGPRELRNFQPTPAQPWLAQTRLIGREYCSYNVAESGKLLLHVAYEPMGRIGVGASTYFSPVRNDALRLMSERIIAATAFTGQISFDAIETPQGLAALECNPRGTSGVHLAAQQPAALAAALLGQPAALDPEILPAPRMLFLPLLLGHPGWCLRADGRRRLRAARDALAAAGIPLGAQLRALAEMSGRALRTGVSIPTASTADIEWNGEPIGE